MTTIYYKQFERNDKYFYIATTIEACCDQSMMWVLKNRIEFSVNNLCIVKGTTASDAELFYCCHFCGKKHEFVDKEKPNIK
jgi:hypothetical protein